jgi:hypothetical protein
MPLKTKAGEMTTRGPDWTDIGQTLRAIESTHSATLVLRIWADGSLYAGSVAVEIVATTPTLIGPAQPLRLSLHSVWPSRKAKTLEGLLYGLLLEMDYRLSNTVYKQAALPGFPPAE